MRRSPSQVIWCRGWDSNPHALSGTAPSTQPVYRFQHPGQFYSSRQLARRRSLSPHLATRSEHRGRPCTWTSEAKRSMRRRASASQSYRETRTCRHVVYLSVRAFITPACPPSRKSRSALRSASGILSHPAKFNRRLRPPFEKFRHGRRGRDTSLGVQTAARGTEKGVCVKIVHPLEQN